MEGLAGQLRYPLRALFDDAAVTLHGTGAVTSGPWLNAGPQLLTHDSPRVTRMRSCTHVGACSRDWLIALPHAESDACNTVYAVTSTWTQVCSSKFALHRGCMALPKTTAVWPRATQRTTRI